MLNKKMRGFTLIEMLIVVAIIGILAALLIPNAMSALQKAKQKGTVKDINSIATAMIDYVSDKGSAPIHSSQITSSTGDTVVTALQGFYMKVFPINDQWGNGYLVYSNTSAWGNGWGVKETSGTCGADEFVIGSYGRDGKTTSTYQTADPSATLYTVSSMTDFNNDIVNWDGSLVIGPRSASSSGT